MIDGIWVNQNTMCDICEKMDIIYAKPLIISNKNLNRNTMIRIVRDGFQSNFNEKTQAEGIVARTEPLLLFRNGEPLKWKLKTRDFNYLKESE